MSERVGLMQTIETFCLALRRNSSSAKLKEVSKALQEAESLKNDLENMESSVPEHKSATGTPNKVKTLEELKSESPNRKLDRFKLQEVTTIFQVA